MKNVIFLFAVVALLSGQLPGQDSLSFGGVYELPGAEVRASYKPTDPLAQRFTIEEVYRLPGTFYDPARLVALLPGVVQTNDQANHLSVRGNSPNANLWRLNGLAIANPNHTANAGTFYDFPTLNGGGVNAISAQVLDNSGFLAGSLPVEYGFASGGTFDLQLRPGSKSRRKYQAQAGFIGFDLTAEGPLGKSGQTSYLINARTSFTGLLAELGADFGGESIRFSDVNAHLHHAWAGGELSVFGIHGGSSNDFVGPDPAETAPESQKDLYEISYRNDVNVYGLSVGLPLGAAKVAGGFAFSSTEPNRSQRAIGPPDALALSTASLNQYSGNLQYVRPLNDWLEVKVGAEFLGQNSQALYFFRDTLGGGTSLRTVAASVNALSPLLGYKLVGSRLTLEGGLRMGLFSGAVDGTALDVRNRLDFRTSRGLFSLAAEVVNSTPLVALLSRMEADPQPIDPIATSRVNLAYGSKIGTIDFRLAVFAQATPDDLAAEVDGFLYSANNLLEADPNLDFNARANTRRIGLELEAGGGRKTAGWYYRGSVTLLRAETEQADGNWTKDRFSADFLAKMTAGREWQGKDRKDRARVLGLNFALIAHGGERYGSIVAPAEGGIISYFAPQDYRLGFNNSTGTYFRPDLRLYKTKTRTKTTTTLALDLQNAAGIQNVGNVYYDTFLMRPNTRNQLGLIPVLSYRIGWR